MTLGTTDWIGLGLAGLMTVPLIVSKLRPKGFSHHFHELREDMTRRGLGPIQQNEEMTFRFHVHRLHRRLRERIPGNAKHSEVIAELVAAATDEANAIKLTDQRLARRFVQAVRDLPLHDILGNDHPYFAARIIDIHHHDHGYLKLKD